MGGWGRWVANERLASLIEFIRKSEFQPIIGNNYWLRVSVIFRIIKVLVSVISLSLGLITVTKNLDIKKS